VSQAFSNQHQPWVNSCNVEVSQQSPVSVTVIVDCGDESDGSAVEEVFQSVSRFGESAVATLRRVNANDSYTLLNSVNHDNDGVAIDDANECRLHDDRGIVG
jgi:hypothetical protein